MGRKPSEWDVAQLVESFPSMQEALDPAPRTRLNLIEVLCTSLGRQCHNCGLTCILVFHQESDLEEEKHTEDLESSEPLGRRLEGVELERAVREGRGQRRSQEGQPPMGEDLERKGPRVVCMTQWDNTQV